MSKVAEQSQKVSTVVADVIQETERLEAVWLECSFTELGQCISYLKGKAGKDSADGVICGKWAELAELIYNKRVEELTGLPVVEGVLYD